MWCCQGNSFGSLFHIIQLRACRRNHLGENQPASENHPHRKDRSLAEPREGALSGVFVALSYVFCMQCLSEIPPSPFNFILYLMVRDGAPADSDKWFDFLQVGVKGNPQGFNRGLDCDVIVAEVNCFTTRLSSSITPFSCCVPSSHVKPCLPGPFHQPQTRWDLRHDREAVAWHQEDRAFRSTPQRPAQLVKYTQNAFLEAAVLINLFYILY